jgi:hypothetical protein
MMKHWLVKQEPDSYPWEQFVRDGKTEWTGVRNFQARNNLRAMSEGDEVFYYHSVKGKCVMGTARCVVLVPVANATDCEAVVARLKPSKAWYLKHHPLNHMLLRLNGLEHGLFRPDLDPLFVTDHSLITYDLILGPSKSTSEYVNRLLDFSRPILTGS